MFMITEFRQRRMEGQFENFRKAIFNVNTYQLELLADLEDYEHEFIKFLEYMTI